MLYSDEPAVAEEFRNLRDCEIDPGEIREIVDEHRHIHRVNDRVVMLLYLLKAEFVVER